MCILYSFQVELTSVVGVSFVQVEVKKSKNFRRSNNKKVVLFGFKIYVRILNHLRNTDSKYYANDAL